MRGNKTEVLLRVDLFMAAYPWITIGWCRNLRRRHRIWLCAWQAGVPSIHRAWRPGGDRARSEEHTSELQSLMRISYAVFCLKKKKKKKSNHNIHTLTLN